MVRAVGFVLSLAATLVLLASSSARAQGVGAIGGTVVDASGAVLPGVTVTLSNPGTIGGNQEVVTDERGAYQFTRLVPGRYSVRGQLTGFRPVVMENLVVNADATARADIKLELGDVSESITVSGQAPLLDTTTALNQAVMDRQVLDTLPGTNDLWGIARVVPSVVMNKYDVGGSESFQQSKIAVHGSNPDGESQYQIDGMNIDASVGATGNVTMYYDPFMFEEINYQTSNGSAENARGGIVYNMITKTGSNAIRGTFMANGSNQNFQSNNITTALRADLLTAVPAKALAANPNIVPGAKILHIFDTGGTLSGPVLKDRLWFAANLKAVGLDQLRLGSYNPDGSQFVDDNLMKTASIKGSWAINSRNQLHATHIFNNKQRFHYNGNVTTGFVESQATWNQTLRTNLDQLKWTSTLSPRLVVDVSGSYSKTLQNLPPQAGVTNGMIPAQDLLTQTTMVAQPTYTRAWYSRRVAHANMSYATSQHNIRAGYQFDMGRNDSYIYSISNFPAGLRANFRNGVPDSVSTYNTPVTTLQDVVEHGLFVQDRWTPARKLTFNLGLRLDRTTSRQAATCQVETIFIAGRCFDAIEKIPNWTDVSPRVAAIYDIFGDGRSAIKVGANRYMVGIGSGTIDLVNPIRVTNDTRSWNDANRDLMPQLSELGPSTGFNLGTTNRYQPGFARPYAAEYSVEFEQQLRRDVVVSVAYFNRQFRRTIGSRNLAVPTSGYIPLNVTEVTSGRQVTVYNQDPATRGRFDVLWNNAPELDRDFNGVDRIRRPQVARPHLVVVRIAGDHLHAVPLDEFERGALRTAAEQPDTRGRRHLYGAALVDPAGQHLGVPLQVAVALRVRHDRPHAAIQQLAQDVIGRWKQRHLRELDQQVAVPVDRVLLRVGEGVLDVVHLQVEVAPAMDGDAGDAPGQFLSPLLDDRRLKAIARVRMRCGDDVGGARVAGPRQHRHALVERARAVVHAVEDVAVQVDEGHGPVLALFLGPLHGP